MGILQDFERRLEGAVEGFFARAFRSGLQPIELAKAVQRYAEDHRSVTTDGVIAPNEYRFGVHPDDLTRLTAFGDLDDELARVVTSTASERGWVLRGPVTITIAPDESVAVGRLTLTGRVLADPSYMAALSAAPQRPAAAGPSAPDQPLVLAPRPDHDEPATRQTRDDGLPFLEGIDLPVHLPLDAPRLTIGRLPTCSLVIEDDTISREHAIVVRRAPHWWILDLGSTNGTRVNGTRTAESKLSPGDELELGDVRLVFRGGDA